MVVSGEEQRGSAIHIHAYNVMCKPGWEGALWENGYMFMSFFLNHSLFKDSI